MPFPHFLFNSCLPSLTLPLHKSSVLPCAKTIPPVYFMSYFMSALEHAVSWLHWGRSCDFEWDLEVPAPLEDAFLFILGRWGCSGCWPCLGGTMGYPIAAVVPREPVPWDGCSSLAGVLCCGWGGCGGGCCLCCSPLPLWGCWCWPLYPLGFLPPLMVRTIFLSKSSMRWRRVVNDTSLPLLGAFFH